jgi:hypothetical protein
MREPIIVREGIMGYSEVNGVFMPKDIKISMAIELCSEVEKINVADYAIYYSLFARLTNISLEELERIRIGQTVEIDVLSTRYTVTRLSKNFFMGLMEQIECVYVTYEEQKEEEEDELYLYN